MESSEASNGFDVRVSAPAPHVAAFVMDLENLPLWDPGCQEAKAIDEHNYLVYDKSFQQRVWYTIKHATPSVLRMTGRGRGFVTRETIVIRPDERDLRCCFVRYTVSVSLRLPYCLCRPCVDAKLNRASTEAGRSLQAYFEQRPYQDACDGEELLFHCEL
jgi:hypothetical protein